jgi:hypothetical protein
MKERTVGIIEGKASPNCQEGSTPRRQDADQRGAVYGSAVSAATAGAFGTPTYKRDEHYLTVIFGFFEITARPQTAKRVPPFLPQTFLHLYRFGNNACGLLNMREFLNIQFFAPMRLKPLIQYLISADAICPYARRDAGNRGFPVYVQLIVKIRNHFNFQIYGIPGMRRVRSSLASVCIRCSLRKRSPAFLYLVATNHTKKESNKTKCLFCSLFVNFAAKLLFPLQLIHAALSLL